MSGYLKRTVTHCNHGCTDISQMDCYWYGRKCLNLMIKMQYLKLHVTSFFLYNISKQEMDFHPQWTMNTNITEKLPYVWRLCALVWAMTLKRRAAAFDPSQLSSSESNVCLIMWSHWQWSFLQVFLWSVCLWRTRLARNGGCQRHAPLFSHYQSFSLQKPSAFELCTALIR